MTFDLSFYRLHDMPDPKIGDIRDFFSRKINFQVRDIDVEKLQSTLKQKNAAPLSIKEGIEIDYENPSTSVYFQMFYAPPHTLDEMPRFQGLEVTGLAAHVNLARPTYFALESIPLITRFADSFNLLTFDGQFSSKHKEPFKADASVLIESWAQTNSWAVASLRKEGHEIKYLARETLDYNWNFLRTGPGMQQMLGDHVFVPTRIFLG